MVFRKLIKLIFKLALLALVVFTAYSLYVDNTSFETVTYDVALSNLPQAFEGYTIVQISDLHGSSFGEENEELLDAVTQAQPDIIVLTGDMAEDDDQQKQTALELCRRLTQTAPVFYVAGNHEWAMEEPREFFDALEQSGVKVLENEAVTLAIGEQSITLAGIGDPNGPYDQVAAEDFVASQPSDQVCIALYHRNDSMESLAQAGAELVICGHAHGGLIRLPGTDGLIGPNRELLPEKTSGLYSCDSGQMVVSRGLGNSGITLRLFNRCHLPVIVLHGENPRA